MQTRELKDILKHCQTFQGADTKRSATQLAVTLILFFATISAMLYAATVSYWIVALLVLPAGGLLTRIFIFQHDCGHSSFWNSKRANDWTGRFLSILTLTPYSFWRRVHNLHHATSGNLDRRGDGGVDTITVREYNALPKWKQYSYRFYRHPLVLIFFGTPFYILIGQRIPFYCAPTFHEDYRVLPLSSVWKSIVLTDIFLVIFYGLAALAIGWKILLAVYLPTLIVTSWIGGWLFYVQHQFEDAYWENGENWDLKQSAFSGSSYYDLPKILQWFTGNIGLHHIHHLSSKIPNYKLQDCMDSLPPLQEINHLNFRDSLRCIHLKLWDENTKKLVSFPKH